ncbi:hypothetical protein [Boseongicola sp. H5]|uniref:hypothetical protein n=1 Tax=Boseongicola sp. H5 TaxID=2763261 RepID=UPI001D0ABD34|nr:hypothetical protein [Boseongicola sp. H5]
MRWILALPLLLAACGDPLPDLDRPLSDAARDAGSPDLVPLGPLLARTDTLLPRDAAAEGQGLEARTADLRRRANALRRMELP